MEVRVVCGGWWEWEDDIRFNNLHWALQKGHLTYRRPLHGASLTDSLTRWQLNLEVCFTLWQRVAVTAYLNWKILVGDDELSHTHAHTHTRRHTGKHSHTHTHARTHTHTHTLAHVNSNLTSSSSWIRMQMQLSNRAQLKGSSSHWFY
jgi:hypothetical protein